MSEQTANTDRYKQDHERRKADPVKWAKKLQQNRESAARHRDARKAYDEQRDRIKKNARGLVRNRIFRGAIQRLPCEKCGNTNSHAHHDDYTKPLEVRWLCPQHHREIHNV